MKLQDLIQTGLDEVSEILAAPYPYSTFEDYLEFKVLLLRRIEFVERRLEFRSEAYLLKENEVFYYDRKTGDFSKLKGGFKELVVQIEGYYTNNQKIINAYSGQIEELEDNLFDRKIPSVFMDIWFDLKKDLSKLENYYYRNIIVYREFYKKTEPLFGAYKDEFKDVEEGIQFQSSNIATLKSRLDGLHHYYDSIKKDRVNKTLFTLTALSGIFLPLNLIVGFFGMNTPGLFFMEDPEGTHNVVYILAGVFSACVLGIPVVHFVDRYILRIILGRYDFYKNISARIDELGERLRGH